MLIKMEKEKKNFITLDKLKVGKKGVIRKVGGTGELRIRLLDMGITPNAEVQVIKKAPMGDPIEIHIRGYELTIRAEDVKNIEIEEVE